MPQSPPVPPFPAPPQLVGTPMSHPFEIWVPFPPSAAPPSGETLRGIYPTAEAPIASPPHKTSQTLSCPLPPFPISSPAVTVFPAPSGGSIPLPANHSWRKKMFVPGTRTNIPPPAVSHTSRRPSPSVPPSPQQPTSMFSSPSHAGTSLKSGAPD